MDRLGAGVHHRDRQPGRSAQLPAGGRESSAAAGVEGVGVHTLRPSAAVRWLESGIHIKQVADLLGHSTIATTGDIYGHGSEDGARRAIDALGAQLGL